MSVARVGVYRRLAAPAANDEEGVRLVPLLMQVVVDVLRKGWWHEVDMALELSCSWIICLYVLDRSLAGGSQKLLCLELRSLQIVDVPSQASFPILASSCSLVTLNMSCYEARTSICLTQIPANKVNESTNPSTLPSAV